jgi:hypothetical protein
VVALQMRKNSKSRDRAREEEDDGKAKSRTCARRVVLKGEGGPIPSTSGPSCQRDFRPHAARPGETTAHSRDASVPAEYGPATSARGHNGAVTSVTSPEMPALITAPTFTATVKTTPTKHPRAAMATITN